MIVFIDTETRSPLSLKKAGLYRYAEEAEVVLVQWAVDGGPVHVECVLDGILPPGLELNLKSADRVVAHNAEFDRVMLAKLTGFTLPWYCTMAQARRHGLPGGLDALCEIFKLPQDVAKSKAGRAAMLLFCKPMKNGEWATQRDFPREWETYVEYARQDITAMRALHGLMPTRNDTPDELACWALDQRINARGFAVDVPFARAAVELLSGTKVDLAEQTRAATNGEVGSATQVSKLAAFILREHGVSLPDMQAATLERRMNDPDLPDAVRELLTLRQQSAKTSTGKYQALLNTASTDGRLRGTKAYCGASRTGRWAGRIFQPDNLPRRDADVSQAEIDLCVRAAKMGCLDLVSQHPVPKILSNAVRAAVIAPPGRKLLVGDLAGIEGRVTAWLAGEHAKSQRYRDYDAGTGADTYCTAYADVFGIKTDDVDKFQRQIGKVMELMLGYGGGVGAFLTGAATYRIDLARMANLAWPSIPMPILHDAGLAWTWAAEQQRTHGLNENVYKACDALKRMWRLAHPRIARMWTDLESAVRLTLMAGRETPVGRVATRRHGTWLGIALPSGRSLYYPGARVEGDKITYMGVNPYTRRWERTGTYGGKLMENIAQAVSRDVLRDAMLDADRRGMRIVGHVHDEIIVETDGRDSLTGLLGCLTREREWTKGLPLAAAGFECTHYRKD